MNTLEELQSSNREILEGNLIDWYNRSSSTDFGKIDDMFYS